MSEMYYDFIPDEPYRTIPDHNRSDGQFCLWSGLMTLQKDALCPERCGTDHEVKRD